MMRTFVAAGAMAQVASAFWPDPAPSATDAVAMKLLGDAEGWTPVPTTAPLRRDMLRRQAATQILGYLAPDNTCGYVAGRIGGIKTCATSDNCAAVLGTDDFYTMGCCGAGACTMQGACYNSVDLASCDQACQQDLNIVKCSQTSYPYCYPYSVPGMNMGFYSCDSVTTSAFQEFETTFSGQSDRATWLALRSSDFDSLLDTSTSIQTTATRSRTSGVETLPISSQTPFTTTPVPNPDDDDDDKSSTPVGAIVGGVVGGLAALGLLAGAIIFFLFKKRKNKQNAAAAASGPAPGTDPHMSQYNAGPPPAGPNGGAAGYFAPVAAGAKFDNSAAKYDGPHGQGPTITESNYPGPTPVSPAPAYSAPVQQHGPVSPQFAPSPAGSPPPPQDPRYSYVPPPQQGFHEAPGAPYQPPAQQPVYPPPPGGAPASQGPAAPVELGNTYAVPNQYQGRPVYEAA